MIRCMITKDQKLNREGLVRVDHALTRLANGGALPWAVSAEDFSALSGSTTPTF